MRKRKRGIKIMGMLGGAAAGTFPTLDSSLERFEEYYQLLLEVIRRHQLDRLDLDIEEPMSLQGIIRLIDRLKAGLGDAFIITSGPVAAAMLTMRNVSGFDYRQLEFACVAKIG